MPASPKSLFQRIIIDTTGVRAGYQQASLAARKYSAESRVAATQASTAVTREGQRMTGGMAKGFGLLKTAVVTAMFAITTAIAGMLRKASREYREFDLEMRRSLAIFADTTATQQRQMAEVAKQTAKELNLVPSEVAKGYFFLASAGLNAQQSIGALPEVAKFAKAGAFDLAKATDLSTDALSALGLKSDDTRENLENLIYVQDNLVKANTLANATVEQFSESLTNRAANAMKLLNIELETGLAVLAAWADQGVKGAEAGTRFEIVTRDLQKAWQTSREEFDRLNISVFDSEGNFRNMGDIIADIENAFSGLTPEMIGVELATLGFQYRTVSAIKSLIGASDSVRRYESDLREAGGTTERVASKQMKALDERIGRLKTRIKVFLQDSVHPFSEGMAKFADSIEKANRSTKQLGDDILSASEQIANLSQAEAAVAVIDELRGVTDLTNEQQQQLTESLETLRRIFPEYASEVNRAGEAMDFYSGSIKSAIRLQRELALVQRSEDLTELIERFAEAETKLSETVAEQQRDVQRQIEVRTVLEKLDAFESRYPGTARSFGQQYKRSHAEQWLRTFDLEIRNASQSAAGFRNEMREAALELNELFRLGRENPEVLTDMFRSAGYSIEEMEDVMQRVRALVASSGRGGGAGVNVGDPTTYPNQRESEVLSLKERYDALTAQRNALVEQGVETDKLAELNREIYEIEQERDRLMKLGLDRLKTEEARLKAILDSEEKIAELRAEGIAHVEGRGLTHGQSTLGAYGFFDRRKTPDLYTRLLQENKIGRDSRGNQVFTENALRQSVLDPEFQKIYDEWTARTEEARDNHKEIEKSLRNMATAGRSVLRVLDIFGDLSDEVASVGNGLLDVVDNLGTLQGLGPDASFGEKLVPGVGIAAGLAAMLTPLFAGDKDARREQVEAIKENTRRIEDAIYEMTEAVRVGSDISRDDAIRATSKLVGAEASGQSFETGDSTDYVREQFSMLFGVMDQAGFAGVDAWREQFGVIADALEAASTAGSDTGVENWKAQLQGFVESINTVLNTIITEQGTFSGTSVSGVLGLGDFLATYAGADQTEVLQTIVQGLQGVEGVSSDLQGYLTQLSGLDPTTEAGQDAIRAIVAALAREEAEGTFDFGGLTPDELADIKSALLGTTTGGVGAGGVVSDATDIVYQVQRQYTAFQANEIIVLAEERNYLLKQIRDIQLSVASDSGALTMDGDKIVLPLDWGRQANVFNVTTTVQPEITEDTLDDLKQQLEYDIRKQVIIKKR